MARATSPALRRGLDVLELFVDGTTELRVPEIVERLRLPRASVHEIVSTLVDRGYLRSDPLRPHQFLLGVRAFQLGSAYEDGLDLAREGHRVATQLAAQCEETVQIGILSNTDVVYVAKVDSIHPVRLVSEVGRRLPAHCTAVGKALLAALTDDELTDRYPDAALPTMTRQSISDREELRRELARVRERGWASETNESNEDVACVAAAVRDKSGQTCGAMSIAVPTIRWDQERAARHTSSIVESAAELSVLLGFRPRGLSSSSYQ